MGKNARAAAGGAARGGGEEGEAIAAEGGHDGGSMAGFWGGVHMWDVLRSV